MHKYSLILFLIYTIPSIFLAYCLYVNITKKLYISTDVNCTFVTPLEAERFKAFMSNDTKSIMDLLFQYSVFEIHTPDNVMKLALKAVRIAIIIQQCRFCMIWDGFFLCKKHYRTMINSLFESLSPTHERLINYLEPCESNEQVQKITTWFHQYIRSCLNEQLENVVRFIIIVLSNLPLDTKMKIRLVSHPPKYVRPHTHTFFKVLLIR